MPLRPSLALGVLLAACGPAHAAGDFLADTDFAPLSAEPVAKSLALTRGQPPYALHGGLREGDLLCLSQEHRRPGGRLRISGAVSSRLALYADGGYTLTQRQRMDPSGKPDGELLPIVGIWTLDAQTGALALSGATRKDGELLDGAWPQGERRAQRRGALEVDLLRVLRDARGQTMVYGQTFSALNATIVTCTLVKAAPQGVSPVAAAHSRAREAQAQHDRFRTAQPGAGLALAQIETVLYHYANQWMGTELQETEAELLLLKDGSGYSNLRWTPHDLDVAASRRGEPDAWFRWRRQGDGYERQGSDGRWTALPGRRCQPLAPAPSGLYGRSSAGLAGAIGMGTAWRSAHHITFEGGGRYSVGGGSSLSGTLGGAGAPVRTQAGSSQLDGAQVGRFVATGYTLATTSASGEVSRAAACWLSGQPDTLVWGGTAWRRGRP